MCSNQRKINNNTTGKHIEKNKIEVTYVVVGLIQYHFLKILIALAGQSSLRPPPQNQHRTVYIHPVLDASLSVAFV